MELTYFHNTQLFTLRDPCLLSAVGLFVVCCRSASSRSGEDSPPLPPLVVVPFLLAALDPLVDTIP